MTSAYDDLVAPGTIGGLKRDIVVAASLGIHRLADIRKWFAERGGAEAAAEATACTVRIVGELIAGGYCRLATWGQDKGSSQPIDATEGELASLVDRTPETGASDYFLVSTEEGNRWATRYLALVAEL